MEIRTNIRRGPKGLYKTPEEIEKAIKIFISKNKRYTRYDLTTALGFKSTTAYNSILTMKGFECVFDLCKFCRRGKGEQYEPIIPIKIKELTIQELADSIQPELNAYCKSKKVRKLVSNKKI